MNITDQLAQELGISKAQASRYAQEVQRLCACTFMYIDILRAVQKSSRVNRTPLHIADLLLRKKRPHQIPASENSPFMLLLQDELLKKTGMEHSYAEILKVYDTFGPYTPVANVLRYFVGKLRRIPAILGVDLKTGTSFIRHVQSMCPGSVDFDDIVDALESLDSGNRNPLSVANVINCEKWPGFVDLNIPDPYVAAIRQEVYRYTGHNFSKKSIEESLRSLDSKATIPTILVTFARKTPIENISVALDLDIDTSARAYRDILDRFGRKIDKLEILVALGRLADSERDPDHLLSMLEILRIAADLNLDYQVAGSLSNDLGRRVGSQVTNEIILRALDVLRPDEKSVSGLLNLIWITWVLHSEFQTVIYLFRSVRNELGQGANDDDVLAVLLAMEDPHFTLPGLRIFINEFLVAKDLGIKQTEARIFLKELNDKFPDESMLRQLVEVSRELEGERRTAENLLPLLNAVEIADYYDIDFERARQLSDSFKSTHELSIFISKEIGFPLSKKLVSDAIRSIVPADQLSPDSMIVSIKLELIAQRISTGRKEAASFTQKMKDRTGRNIRHDELLVLLKYVDTGDDPIDTCIDLVWISERFGLGFEDTGILVKRIRGISNGPSRARVSDIVQVLKEEGILVDSREEAIAYFELSFALKEIGWDGTAASFAARINESFVPAVQYSLLVEALGKVDRSQLPEAMIGWLRERLRIPTLALALGISVHNASNLPDLVKTRTGKTVAFEDLLKVVDNLPRSIKSLVQISDAISLLVLSGGQNPSLEKIPDAVNHLSAHRELREYFWQEFASLSQKEETTLSDALYTLWIYRIGYLSRSLFKPDAVRGEQWITEHRIGRISKSGRIADLDRNRKNETVSILQRLRDRAWKEILSDDRRYQVPSQGRAIILASDKIQQRIALESLQFVSEGAVAPGLHIRFKFLTTPIQIGLVKLYSDGRIEGFHKMLSNSHFLQSLIEAVAVSYYRDLVLSTIYRPDPGKYRHWIKQAAPRGIVQNRSSPRDIPRRSNSRLEKYHLEEWRESQHLARHYVVGHIRFIGHGFVADGERHDLARRAGVQLPDGYTWVIPHERGDPRFGRLALNGFDLPSRTIFYHPKRATRELDRILS